MAATDKARGSLADAQKKATEAMQNLKKAEASRNQAQEKSCQRTRGRSGGFKAKEAHESAKSSFGKYKKAEEDEKAAKNKLADEKKRAEEANKEAAKSEQKRTKALQLFEELTKSRQTIQMQVAEEAKRRAEAEKKAADQQKLTQDTEKRTEGESKEVGGRGQPQEREMGRRRPRMI